MHCDYFGQCGSCNVYDLNYEEQLSLKKENLQKLFAPLKVSTIELFKSKDTHYRNRAEFRIWHEKEKISYAMGHMDKKGVVLIDKCPKVVQSIFDLMPLLKEKIESNEILRKKLFAVEFLSGSKNMLVSLLYHKPIDQIWEEEAKKLEESLHVNIIGRSRKIKKVLSQDFILDGQKIDEKEFSYKIIEGGFSQPNSFVNKKMIQWVLSKVQKPQDLLELYCGHGNFTLPLSQKFDKVLATEISKSSISSAQSSCELNDISNISFLRMSVEDLTSAFNKERKFNRLREIDLEKFDFSHVFVDPPRAGIDTKSLDFLKRFETIIYISCNPLTLKRDIEYLQEYDITDFALFDQFPYTLHVETGAILKKRII